MRTQVRKYNIPITTKHPTEVICNKFYGRFQQLRSYAKYWLSPSNIRKCSQKFITTHYCFQDIIHSLKKKNHMILANWNVQKAKILRWSCHKREIVDFVFLILNNLFCHGNWRPYYFNIIYNPSSTSDIKPFILHDFTFFLI